MTRLAIVDLDGVVAESSARFAKAEEVKATFLDDTARNDLATAHKSDWNAVKQEATSLYWQTAFTPELVALDTLIENAIEHIGTLERRGYRVVFLTSRPESMREATAAWMYQQGIMVSPYLSQHSPVRYELVMKSSAFSDARIYTKVWKAAMVQTLAGLYGADDIVFIDDEIENCQEACKYQPIPLVFTSLAEAIEKL